MKTGTNSASSYHARLGQVLDAKFVQILNCCSIVRLLRVYCLVLAEDFLSLLDCFQNLNGTTINLLFLLYRWCRF